MSSKILKIDVDGVACAHAEAICKRLNAEYELNVSADEVKSWDYDFGPISFIEAVNKYYPDENFIISMNLLPGIKEFLMKVTKYYNTGFITTRSVSHKATEKWIKKEIGNYEIEFVKKKMEASFDILIDDNETEIIEIVKKSRIGILLTRPWNDNKNVQDELMNMKNSYICKNFDEIYELLSGSER